MIKSFHTPKVHSGKLNELYGALGDLRHDFRNSALYELLLDFANGSTFFDVGAGVGHLLSRARERGFRVAGVEPDPELIAFGERLYGKLNVQPIGVESLAHSAARFDTLTLIDVMEHVPDDRAALQNIIPLLNADGKIIIVVPAYPWLYNNRDRAVGHERRYRRSDFLQLVRETGLHVEHLRFWNALGVLPYALLGILKSPNIAVTSLRNVSSGSLPQRALRRFLSWWFRVVEHHIDFGFGLSMICVARMPAMRKENKQEKLKEQIAGLYNFVPFLDRIHIMKRIERGGFLTASKHIPKEGVIADIGCGYGIFANLLHCESPARLVFGVDIDERKIRIASRTVGERRGIMFSTTIEALSRPCDAIMLIDVLYLLPAVRQRALLGELAAHLGSAGKFIIKATNTRSIMFHKVFLQEMIMVKLLKRTKGSSIAFVPLSKIISWLGELGFRVRVEKIASRSPAKLIIAERV